MLLSMVSMVDWTLYAQQDLEVGLSAEDKALVKEKKIPTSEVPKQ